MCEEVLQPLLIWEGEKLHEQCLEDWALSSCCPGYLSIEDHDSRRGGWRKELMVMREQRGTASCVLEDQGSGITWERVRNAESTESEFLGMGFRNVRVLPAALGQLKMLYL